jgi:hypothetical protein
MSIQLVTDNKQTHDLNSTGYETYNYATVGAGPAAELARILGQLIGLYQELMAQWAQMSNAETKVQGQTGLASALAQRDAGRQQAKATSCQAWQEGLGAGMAVTQVGIQFGTTHALNGQIANEQTQLSQLNGLHETVQTRMTSNPQDIVTQEEGAHNPRENPGVTNRILEMQAGRFKSNVPNVSDETAISAAHNGELTQIKEQLDGQISNKHEAINSISSQIQQRVSYVQMAGQSLNGCTGSITHGLSAGHQAQQGAEQAASTVNSTASQMAGSAQNNAQGYLGKYYDMIAGLMAQFRAGAQAYPQG